MQTQGPFFHKWMENSGLRLNLDTESWVAITEQNLF